MPSALRVELESLLRHRKLDQTLTTNMWADVERARVNATRAIGAVLRKIAAADPVLGEHLAASVRTGLFCSYQPGTGRVLRWEL